MINLKKLFTLLSIAAFSFILAACGEQGEESDMTDTGGEQSMMEETEDAASEAWQETKEMGDEAAESVEEAYDETADAVKDATSEDSTMEKMGDEAEEMGDEAEDMADEAADDMEDAMQ